MPAPKKITREDIINSAFAILCSSGISAVNARIIAAKLGCSTQPIYRSFRNMDELKQELRKSAADIYLQQVKSYQSQSKYTDYQSYGLGFVRLAREEKQLFRYLYLSEHPQNCQVTADESANQVIKALCDQFGYDEVTAKNFHYDVTVYSYGLAIGMNIGLLNLTDEEISTRLKTEFKALTAVYGLPPKFKKPL